MKMKIAVIFGVSQMSLGIFIKALNAIHFSRYVDLFFEFLPQITLLTLLFGWMDYLIVAKWLNNWDYRGASPPGIISIMINMFLEFGKIAENADPIIGHRFDRSTQQNISRV